MASQPKSATHIPATMVHRNFSDLIKRVFTDKERIIVEKDGLPVVAIIPINEYEEWQQEKERREERLRRFEDAARAIGLEVQKSGYTEEQMMQDLEETRRDLFKKHYGDIE